MPLFLVILLTFSCLFPVFGLDLPLSQIADDSLLRIKLKDTWLNESPAKVLSGRSGIQYLESGERVEVRAEAGKDEFMVLFSRELTSGQFPGWAQGSWMLIRRTDTGAGTLIRVFPRSDQYTYIQFRPLNTERSQMDVVLYGGYAVRSLPIAVPFERLYTMPLNDTLKLAGDRFPRRYFEPDPDNYHDQRKLVALVRERLGKLRFTDDGAINENGDYVFIETLERQSAAFAGLNCSGFAKWLIDGVLRPVTGARLPIPPLKAPFGRRGSSFTDLWEEVRDPFFGLDWIRNLAAEANETLRSGVYANLDEFEVRNAVFSGVSILENRTFVIQSYPGFLENAGYGIEGIHPLLYALAIDDPHKWYLAAVNTEIGETITQDNLRGAPRMRQYFHVAALIPYFDEYGIFRIVVFESAAETSFNAFKNRYPGHYVNLVQIPIVTAFDP